MWRSLESTSLFDRPIFEISSPGRLGVSLPPLPDVPDPALAGIQDLLRDGLDFPEVSEPQVVRHFVALSRKNYHIDLGMYPLGSCTMKYNPKLDEDAAAMGGFAGLHPLTPASQAQGALAVMHELARFLVDLTGMDDCTLQPAAGAQGELTALMMIRAHFRKLGQARNQVLVPDSAHGTNPASAAMCGMTVRQIRSSSRGRIDLSDLKTLLGEHTACVMVTNPNTLGLFEDEILEVARLTHEAGAFLYMDGANFNALLGRARPGDMGFDVMHINLHKTFSTPHGGGGPGSGPVMVKKTLAPYLPVPRVVAVATAGGGSPRFDLSPEAPDSIGQIHGFYGNFGMHLRAYTYILSLGLAGLRRISLAAVLNANYLKARVKEQVGDAFVDVHPGPCMHEFVIDGTPLKRHDVRTLDVAKRLLDHGFHAPTIYFPLIVPECMMIEPTESECLDSLDAFARAMGAIVREAREKPELLRSAPHTTPVRRLDETRAARHPILTHAASRRAAAQAAAQAPASSQPAQFVRAAQSGQTAQDGAPSGSGERDRGAPPSRAAGPSASHAPARVAGHSSAKSSSKPHDRDSSRGVTKATAKATTRASIRPHGHSAEF